MKKTGKLALLGILAALTLTSFAQAADGNRPLSEENTGNSALWWRRPYWGYYGWGYYPRYYAYYNYCYWYPGLCYWYLRTSSDNLSTDVTSTIDPQTIQTYTDDAANFLQNGGEPTPTLRQAMDREREALLKSGVQEARNLNDNVLASLVASRAMQPSETTENGGN